MTGSSILLFSVALGIACATPGPTTMALVSRVVASGVSGAAYFCAGLVLGDVFWLLCATLGFAALVMTAGPLFQIIQLLGAAYLLYIGWRLWTAPVAVAGGAPAIEGERTQLGIAGLSVAIGNPKTMLFYLALVPVLLPLGTVALSDVLLLSALVVAVCGAVLGFYVLLASRARRFLQSPRALRAVNKVSGAVVAVTAVFVALR